MRRRVGVLVAIISTAIVASFVIPLLLLVNAIAADRGMAVASQQANTVAVLVSSLHADPRLADLLQPSLSGSPARTSVVLADGRVLGASWPDASADPAYQRAIQGEAFSVRDADGGRVYVPVLVDGGVAVIRAAMTPDQLAEGVPLAWVSIIALGLVLSGVGMNALDLGDIVDICIDNVFAHTPEGSGFGIRLDASGQWAILLVSDAGSGFPRERGEPRPGTSGMGLRIARRLVEQAGGRLGTSAPGRPGAEVRIELPVQSSASRTN